MLKGNKAIIEILLAAHAKADIPDAAGKTALDYAVESSNQEIQALLKFNLLRPLLEKYHLTDETQATLEKGLRNAVSREEAEDVKSFVQLVESINARDTNPTSQKTALHWAVLKGNKAIIEILLAAHAKTDIPDSAGKTAKDYAAESSNEEIRALLSANKQTSASLSK